MRVLSYQSTLTFSFPVLLFVTVFFLFSFPAKAAEDHDITGSSIVKTLTIPGMSVKYSGLSGTIESITIPLKRAGRLFLLEAHIDNESGNFIFDTGAADLVLNSTYFRKYMTMDLEEGGGVTGTSGKVRRTKVKRLMVAELSFENITADVVDLGHIENRRGFKIFGLFGLSLIKEFELVIDLNHNQLHLFRLDKAGNRLNTKLDAFKADLVRKVEEYHNVIFVKAKIGGKILDFCLDTGAESNVLNSDASRKVLNTVTILRRSDLKGVGSGDSEVLFGTLNDFELGDKKVSDMQTIITSLDAMSQSYGFPIDGMLGFDFFEKGEICVNLVKQEMKICFNKGDKP
jgi:predicted aspartyl protease